MQQFLRTILRGVLNSSNDGDSAASLGNLYHNLTMFIDIVYVPSVCQFA